MINEKQLSDVLNYFDAAISPWVSPDTFSLDSLRESYAARFPSVSVRELLKYSEAIMRHKLLVAVVSEAIKKYVIIKDGE